MYYIKQSNSSNDKLLVDEKRLRKLKLEKIYQLNDFVVFWYLFIYLFTFIAFINCMKLVISPNSLFFFPFHPTSAIYYLNLMHLQRIYLLKNRSGLLTDRSCTAIFLLLTDYGYISCSEILFSFMQH